MRRVKKIGNAHLKWAFSEAAWDFKAGMAYVYGGPGKMSAMAMAPAEKNHEAMMKSAKKVPDNPAVVSILGNLLKDPALGPRVVPIVADEARTFGMASLFRQVGIYAPLGQLYQPEDSGSMLYYREDKSGQILEEGITEAGALSSWTAAAGEVAADKDGAPFGVAGGPRSSSARRPEPGVPAAAVRARGVADRPLLPPAPPVNNLPPTA